MERNFNINPEENQRFHLTHEHEVILMLKNKRHEIEPDETSNLNAPRHANDVMKSISELNRIINSFKNNTSGESQKNKVILQKLPASAISKLQEIYNHSLTIRYFPDQLKTASLKFIPKNNSDTTNPMNFRPISLLETTGKIIDTFLNNRVRDLLEKKQFYPNSQEEKGVQILL